MRQATGRFIGALAAAGIIATLAAAAEAGGPGTGAPGWSTATEELKKLADALGWLHRTVAWTLSLVAVFTLLATALRGYFGDFPFDWLNTTLAAVVYLALSGFVLGFVFEGEDARDWTAGGPSALGDTPPSLAVRGRTARESGRTGTSPSPPGGYVGPR